MKLLLILIKRSKKCLKKIKNNNNKLIYKYNFYLETNFFKYVPHEIQNIKFVKKDEIAI